MSNFTFELDFVLKEEETQVIFEFLDKLLLKQNFLAGNEIRFLDILFNLSESKLYRNRLLDLQFLLLYLSNTLQSKEVRVCHYILHILLNYFSLMEVPNYSVIFENYLLKNIIECMGNYAEQDIVETSLKIL